ncbi:MAG: uroporphyrinogen decarboxylase family protein [Oscillospiraceae bacterium]
MMSKKYEENLKLIQEGLACTNEKPISCYSGSAPGAVMMGMTVAEFVEKPVEGALAAIEMCKRLEKEAGPLHSLNYSADSMNSVVGITMLWYSRVLIPGKEISENSVWQVQEKQLIDSSAYDEILKNGFDNFVQQNILPRIIDMDYMKRSMKVAAEGAHVIEQAYAELGIPRLRGGRGPVVPFEQLCGMRSMSQFYMDCYKMPDKLKEVSDAIFAEKTAQAEDYLKKTKDDPTFIGAWIGGWRTASAMLNQKIWDKLVWPYMKTAAELLNKYDKVAIMHLDQDWNRDIARFGEIPAGKIILNTDGMTDLPRARRLLPKHALMGDVPATLLTTGSTEQVRDYVNRLIDNVGPQGLFVCPGCDTPVNAKFENLVAMVKTTNEWH